VPGGSFFGLVGPNGAGKTTTLSMAVGLLRPDAGRSQVFGVDVWADPVAAKQLLGVLPDGLALPERLTGRELLAYLGQLRGLDRATVAARASELLEVLELTEAERTLVTDYSAGMRKKATLATALLHTPRLLVLDEPFEAIDPVSAATIGTILRRFVDAGGSVVLSSHGWRWWSSCATWSPPGRWRRSAATAPWTRPSCGWPAPASPPRACRG
jgi:ABC-2 type transport system ATP-binding protein